MVIYRQVPYFSLSDIEPTKGMHVSNKNSSGTSGTGVAVMGAMGKVLGTDSNSAYDMKSATWLAFILSFLLCWIPIVGQMVAGYVGGRRAGSPARGVFSTTVAVAAVLGILLVLSVGLFSIDGLLSGDAEAKVEAIGETSPVLGEILTSGLSYLGAFYTSTGKISIDFKLYFITIAFGFIGGILADQSRKEARLLVQSSYAATPSHHARSLDMHLAGKKMGFESFDDYKAISVNSMATAAPVSKIKEAPVRTAAVTATVEASSKGATPTSSCDSEHKDGPFSGLLHKADKKSDPMMVKSSPEDEYKYV